MEASNGSVVYAASLASVKEASARISGHAKVTPVLTCSTLDGMMPGASERKLFFKCELFQKGGAFKFRGACNAVMSLTDEVAARGVCTHSSGNHAQAVSLAARARGVPAHIVMPDNAPAVKQAAVKGYGASVTFCPQVERAATAEQVVKATGAEFIHPSNDPRVISGQGTIALELLSQTADAPLDAIIVPLGGGGLISGIAVAAKAINPAIRIFGAEPASANDAYRSKHVEKRLVGHEDGGPNTVADGLRTTLGSNTWPIVRDLVERIITVDEDAIIRCTRLVWERMKLCIEPSAGVGVAVALSEEFASLKGMKRVGVVLCGGNIDLDTSLPWAS